MTVDKIGNTISLPVTMHMKIAEKKSHPQLETSDTVSISTKPEIKGTTKTNDPPFFPICVTQSMFKTEK
ncbi:MAG: hypothetical protein C0399_00120 [Syntrophus sp. (in: bacteria)]|nr:hypothetical protein [Syntrophus sp. (in: bacteria)]